MENILAKPQKDDSRSLFSFLGQASIKAIDLQGTEYPPLCLLDIVFVTVLDDGHTAEFLIRLETPHDEIEDFQRKLGHAINNPKQHPYRDDLFSKAVTGMTPRERGEEQISALRKGRNGI